MMDRERIDVVDLVGVVSTNEIAEKESFEGVEVDEVDDEAVGAFATAKIEEKDSDFEAFLGVVSDCFSGLL